MKALDVAVTVSRLRGPLRGEINDFALYSFCTAVRGRKDKVLKLDALRGRNKDTIEGGENKTTRRGTPNSNDSA